MAFTFQIVHQTGVGFQISSEDPHVRQWHHDNVILQRPLWGRNGLGCVSAAIPTNPDRTCPLPEFLWTPTERGHVWDPLSLSLSCFLYAGTRQGSM
ncbi:hypothetical protein M413DRAFT_321734 [Hebeloma cylindrosporum]|uniref:Uncharacterized protein n=1 Tax=Hebeloma cylindrosporum TaxID=76867 RepID=A0A0C2XDT3_HEBCY|nr:hypothetical protein M413DRAFT_321734 [Hebeloma cylindrosporum h7]